MQILSELNPIQQAAVVFDIQKPLLILAGAGSGKTRVLTYRVAYMISQKAVNSSEILLLTFTNKAAGEMTKRVNLLLKQEFFGYAGTYHSFCARILRKYGLVLGIDQNFVIFDQADQLDTVKQAMANLNMDIKTVRPNSVLGAISDAKNNLVEPNDYANYARGNFQQTVARVYLAYQQLLKRYRALDFDDLLTGAVKLLKGHKEIKEKISQTFKYLLVDEYQDTNKAQYEITKEIAKPGNRITVVGDAAQAIYSWRGADYRNLMYLKRDFSNLEIINLEQNYRSTQIILSASNSVVAKNKNHPVLKLWTKKGGGEKITIYEAESELEEASFIVTKIQSDIVTKKSKYADFAILYRTNAQSRVLEEAMLSAGIPYVLVGGVRFYERKEIKDILAYLRLIINPDDEVSRKRAEKNGKARLNKLMANGEWRMEEKTLNILDQVLKLTEYLDQYDPLNEEDAARLENIKELRSVAMEHTNLSEFLEQVALSEQESKTPLRQGFAGQGAVTLMTMHSAKGLEFKTVFMVGMEEGLFPHSRTLMDREQLEEERRLCYVGMTRAMDKLCLTYARRRLYFGTRSSNMVSRFLGDIPQELISTNGNGFNGLKKKNKHVDEGFGFDREGNWKWKPEE